MSEDRVGTVKISEDVIASITNMAACEVEGVSKLVLKSISNIKTAIPNYKPAVKGVSIANIPNGGMELTLQIAVKQGHKLQDVAKRVQDNVLDAVQNMTGLSVKKVNVVVAGIVEEKKPATDLKETKK